MPSTSPAAGARAAAEDLAVAGYLGTKAMEPVSEKRYTLESDTDRAREDAVRPGPSYRIAAEKITRLIGLRRDDQQLDTAALVFRYGLVIFWAPLYALLRRAIGLRPITAGLATGSAMSLLADELMTPAAGFSAPNRAYPLATHLRGFTGHLAFGLAVPRSPRPRGHRRHRRHRRP
ncbi:MAG: DUF1440 domain-containing protein [Pseudonocardiaceae bacterium]